MAPASSFGQGPVIILAHGLARAIGKAGNRRCSSPPMSMAAQTAVTSAWSRANKWGARAPCRRRGKRRLSGRLISQPMPGVHTARGRAAPAAASVVEIGRASGTKGCPHW